jgi:acetyltransferase-like isoleucine patch superfamily enzyme
MANWIKLRINNRIYLLKKRKEKFKKNTDSFFYKTLLKREYYIPLDKSQLFINWMFQRVFRNNSKVPFSVSFTSTIYGFKNIILPKNSDSIKTSFAVSGGCYFGICDGTTLEIGENTLWAYNVCIQTSNHDLYDRNKYKLASIKIGKNCWIGNGVAILAGVELGDNVTIGANSVVTKSFPSNVVIAGCPARIIKNLDVK